MKPQHPAARFFVIPKFFCILLSLSCLLAAPAQAMDDATKQVVNQALDQGRLIGEGRLTYIFLDVYDAQLFAARGAFSPTGEYALALRYLMDFDGIDITKRSIDEMQEQGYRDVPQLAKWQTFMSDTFPDVKENDTLIGVRTSTGSSRFFHNGQFVGELDDPEFTNAFFGIWLAPNTSEPKLRQKLLGLRR